MSYTGTHRSSTQAMEKSVSLSIYTFFMVFYSVTIDVTSSFCTNSADGGGYFENDYKYMVINLQVSCNETDLQFKLFGTDNRDSSLAFGEAVDVQYYCFNELDQMILERTSTIDNYAYFEEFASLPDAPKGCNVTYHYIDFDDNPQSIQACCQVSQAQASSSVPTPTLTSSSTAIPVPTQVYITTATSIVSSLEVVTLTTTTSLTHSLPVTTSTNTPTASKTPPIQLYVASIVLSFGIIPFILIMLFVTLHASLKRYHYYKRQESRQNIHKYYHEVFDLDSNPVDFVSKMTITLSLESIIFPMGSKSRIYSKKEVDCECDVEDDIKSWRFDCDGYLNKCEMCIHKKEQNIYKCECCHSWDSVTQSQNEYSKCGSSIITSLLRTSHNSSKTINIDDTFSVAATPDELKNSDKTSHFEEGTGVYKQSNESINQSNCHIQDTINQHRTNSDDSGIII